MSERSGAASCGGNARESVGGSEQSQTRPAAGSDYCDECGCLTTDPHVIDGWVFCGPCARQERLQKTDYANCDCRKCGGTDDL